LVSHLEEMDAAEYLDEADAVERPLLNGEVELFNPVLICARHSESFLLLPAAGLAGSSQNKSPAIKGLRRLREPPANRASAHCRD
jgi:hypothetical protein